MHKKYRKKASFRGRQIRIEQVIQIHAIGHMPMCSMTDGAYPEGHKKFPFECSLKGTILLNILTTVFS